jgi:hypothetical protein
VLSLWHIDYETVELVGKHNLAREPRCCSYIFGEIEHRLLHVPALAYFVHPRLINKDVTGSAGAGATAIGIDTWDIITHRGFHYAAAGWDIDFVRRSVKFYKGNLRH